METIDPIINISDEHAGEQEPDPDWTADRLWQSEPSIIRRRLTELIAELPNNLKALYDNEPTLLDPKHPEIAQDPLRYIGFPLIEASAIVARVKEQVNRGVSQPSLSYSWLSLFDEFIDHGQIVSAPQYISLTELADEVHYQIGFKINVELHNELSANQTQYLISWLLNEATDINWPKPELNDLTE